jgi:hypothetical protein
LSGQSVGQTGRVRTFQRDESWNAKPARLPEGLSRPIALGRPWESQNLGACGRLFLQAENRHERRLGRGGLPASSLAD